VDARDRLREYLEQRRELGESEFVLDGLSVEEALNALGVRSGAAGKPPAHESPREARTTGPAGHDWREALRSVGVDQPGKAASAKAPKEQAVGEEAVGNDVVGGDAPSEPPAVKVGRYEMPAPTEPSENATGELKQGIVFGSRMEPGNGAHANLDSIAAIAKAVAACTACGLYVGAKNPVPGEGDPHAGFVCVGEAPGQTEDEQGKPFVGASGQLLTKILAAINFKREDVFICNVIKHRPPGNRNPSPDEIKACSPFLMRQLELLQPRVILALGTFAAQTLLQTTTPIGKLRGQVHRYYGVPLIVTYHPAALLRNPSWKRPTWEDVQLARRVFDSAASGA
jgi:uracil-DNA glycosylase family 4